MTASRILEDLNKTSLSQRYTVYVTLLTKLKDEEEILKENCRHVHSLDYLKGLLRMRKEYAIQRLKAILPLLKVNGVEAKSLILKILPVVLSYVTLYDTEIHEVFEIMEIIKTHPAYSQDKRLFQQWFEIFEKRSQSEKKFQYKDESYFYELSTPSVEIINRGIGYSDVNLLRTVHRWLRALRLHKYLFFFANLSYRQIISINHCNILYYERNVGVSDMTQGARNKILREVEDLRNRPARLKSIIAKTRCNSSELEDSVRDLKKVMRSPISVVFERKLINLLFDTLKKVTRAMEALIGTSEKVIPLYGLTLSILKEAYNYSYFNNQQKESFNTMRSMLTNKINSTQTKTNICVKIISVPAEHDDDEDNSIDDYDDSMNFTEMEMIAIQMAEFVLND